MSGQLMSKQHSWPFPCIKPEFEGHSLPDEVVRLVALFALPTHPLKVVFLAMLAEMDVMNRRILAYTSVNPEDPKDSFLAWWFVTNVFVNLQFISLFLFFFSNEGHQKILASKPPQPKGLV